MRPSLGVTAKSDAPEELDGGHLGPVVAPPGVSAAARLTGRTPIVELSKLALGARHRLLAKCEFLNPTGSVKDRIGHHILDSAERRGLITPGLSTLVEATAGNTGAALAAAAAGRYGLVVTMSTKMGSEKEAMMRSWGAQVVRCPYEVPPESSDSFINTARRIAGEVPAGYYVDQFNTGWNAEAHELTTGPEIYQQTGGEVAAFVCGVGTGGTFTGVGRYLRRMGSEAELVAADPVGSILAGLVAGRKEPARPYLIEGIGGDFLPGQLDLGLVSAAVSVPDRESVQMCLRLQRQEGISVGGSSGCALVVALRLAHTLPGPAGNVVVLLADAGTRYASTIFDAGWRAAHDLDGELMV